MYDSRIWSMQIFCWLFFSDQYFAMILKATSFVHKAHSGSDSQAKKDIWVDPNPWVGATLVVRPHYHAWPPTTSYLQIIFCSVRIFEKVFIRTNIQEGCLLLYCCIIAYFAPVLPLCHETVDCLNVTKQSRCQGRKDHGGAWSWNCRL